jgi:hypothetical protein
MQSSAGASEAQVGDLGTASSGEWACKQTQSNRYALTHKLNKQTTQSSAGASGATEVDLGSASSRDKAWFTS